MANHDDDLLDSPQGVALRYVKDVQVDEEIVSFCLNNDLQIVKITSNLQPGDKYLTMISRFNYIIQDSHEALFSHYPVVVVKQNIPDELRFEYIGYGIPLEGEYYLIDDKPGLHLYKGSLVKMTTKKHCYRMIDNNS